MLITSFDNTSVSSNTLIYQPSWKVPDNLLLVGYFILKSLVSDNTNRFIGVSIRLYGTCVSTKSSGFAPFPPFYAAVLALIGRVVIGSFTTSTCSFSIILSQNN